MIMCVLLCYPVSIHMSQLLSTGRPISSYIHFKFGNFSTVFQTLCNSKHLSSCGCNKP